MATLNVPDDNIEVANASQRYFRKLPIDKRYTSHTYTNYRPKNPVAENSLYSFTLPAWTNGNVFDLKNIVLNIKVKLMAVDDTTKNIRVPDEAKHEYPSIANNILHSMFKSLHIKLNQTRVTKDEDYYGYKAYISHILSKSKSSCDTWMKGNGFYMDSSGELDNFTLWNTNPEETTDKGINPFKQTSSNLGFVERQELFKTDAYQSVIYSGQERQFSGNLFSEFSSLTSEILPGVEVLIELKRQDDEWLILNHKNSPTFKVILTDINLDVPILAMSTDLYRHTMNTLKTKPAVYNIVRTYLRHQFIPAKSNSVYFEHFFADNIYPARFAITFVYDAGFRGVQNRNPFNFNYCFRNYNKYNIELSNSYIKKLEVSQNSVPLTSLQGDFTERDCQKEFKRFNSILRTDHRPINIDYAAFKNGYYFGIYDLTAGATNIANSTPSIRSGPIRISIEFSNEIHESLRMLVFCERRETITIKDDGQVRTSYTV